MKLFFCEVFKTYTAKTTIAALKHMGHQVSDHLYATPEDIHGDAQTIGRIASDIEKELPDAVFTINFWGVVAQACHDRDVPYIAWVYDSPMEIRDISPMSYDTNRIFLFDRTEYAKFLRMGMGTVFYLPLAADIKAAGQLKPWQKPLEVSLVGSLYASTYSALRSPMGAYEGGYLDAVAAAQQKIFAGYFVPELLTKDIIDGINRTYAAHANGSGGFAINADQLSYSIAEELTHRDRLLLLAMLSARFSTTLFTFDIRPEDRRILSRVSVEKAVDYDTQMPRVFASSKINLNPILRANGDGIPLRALDVLGSGGFLLSSFREDFLNYFLPEEEIVLYDSIEEAVEKAEFYMKNDALRKKIAHAGLERVRNDFSYESRLEFMLKKI